MKDNMRVKWDEFDGSIIGFCFDTDRYIYDSDIMVTTLMSRDGMSYTEAWEYLEFNVFQNHMADVDGKYITPIHLIREHNID